MGNHIHIHPLDNVAVLISASGAIPAGHKAAICNISKGRPVIKYGCPIGIATRDIVCGEWVHSHNLETALCNELEYVYAPISDTVQSHAIGKTFNGYIRHDGSVGIRNEVWIIPTVGCVNAIAKLIEEESKPFLPPAMNTVVAYSHPYGCSQLGDDKLNTERALCGLIRHPNAAGVLVLGLGCENSNISAIKAVLGDYDSQRVKFLNCQDFDDEVAVALPLVKELCEYAAGFHREPCSIDKLVVGLKCGGSDGFSGITANPLLGRFTDMLTDAGGSAILTEVPEMFGAETILMNRCRTETVFRQTVALINDFKAYFLDNGQPVGENPSPGNKDGGITTLEEKSLGCVQKGGTSPITAVLCYGEAVYTPFLSLLNAPGNDLVASAALAMSGAQLVLFTTGRGTPFGCPVPTVKIASNSAFAQKKSHWIDFDAGRLLTGSPIGELAEEFFDYIVAIASGEQHAKSERLDKRDLAIFKSGVTL